jgi:hypothetical protein
MKIKLDHVSNSSSTSFVYIAKEEISEEEFIKAAGVDLNSPVAPLFKSMFQQLNERLCRADTVHSKEDVDQLSDGHDFTSEVLDRMKAAIDAGVAVKVGEFSSEECLAESVLCMEMVEIESERFYLNAYDNAW